MPNFLIHQQWLLIALIFFGIIGYIAWIRWRDRKWIEARFGKDPALAMSFGVNYYGRATEPGKPKRSSGFLLLLPDRLFYRSRMAGLEIEIASSQIHRVYPGHTHKGVELHQSVVKVEFLTPDGQKDVVAFKVPYPPQWVHAIEGTLLAHNAPANKNTG
jgi:hypothetical protein